MDEEEILNREIAKFGALGGAIGGSSAIAGALGGAAGAYIASKFLPTETHSQEITIGENAKFTLVTSLRILSELGKLNQIEDIKMKNPCISAIIGSGFFNLNPCSVVVEIISSSGHQTKIAVTGAAKEGLIKQNTARKAVSRVVEKLELAMSQNPCDKAVT